jgi:hypothetical protein
VHRRGPDRRAARRCTASRVEASSLVTKAWMATSSRLSRTSTRCPARTRRAGTE